MRSSLLLRPLAAPATDMLPDLNFRSAFTTTAAAAAAAAAAVVVVAAAAAAAGKGM